MIVIGAFLYHEWGSSLCWVCSFAPHKCNKDVTGAIEVPHATNLVSNSMKGAPKFVTQAYSNAEDGAACGY